MSIKKSLENIKKLYGMDEKDILTVSEISAYIKKKLVNDPKINSIYVFGEITNLSRPDSGHIYFDLKDEQSLIKCAFFRGNYINLPFELENGLEVLVLGSITTYEKRSNYQLSISRILPLGEGAFYLQFKQLKLKLSKEGLFNAEHKKEIPKIPKCIGLITSKKGSVIGDIFNVQKSRFPNMNLKLIGTIMQGDKASQEIIKGINILNQYKDIDIIIIARGGGSIEDLMCFNDEELARAIFKSKIPIVTGIGHETDHTIADFVADQMAPTPSVAAKIAVPDKQELLERIDSIRNELKKSYKNYITSQHSGLNKLSEMIKFTRNQLQKSYKNCIVSKHKELDKLAERINSLKNELHKSHKNYINSKKKDGESKKYKRIILFIIIPIIIYIIYLIVKLFVGN